MSNDVMRRKRQKQEDEHLDRWLVSYADFITLLFAFFVVMYSMSSVNEGKYRVLSDTMVAAFNTPPKSIDPIQLGKERKTLIKEQKVIENIKPVELLEKENNEENQQMVAIADSVKDALKPLINKGLVNVNYNKLWVEVELNNSLLFDIGSADLEAESKDVIGQLAKLIAPLPNQIDVEGHTDNVPIKNEIYPTNWELSASRSASLVRALSRMGVTPNRLTAIGYGEFRPKESNNTSQGRQKNRRVAVVILADKNARRMTVIEGKK